MAPDDANEEPYRLSHDERARLRPTVNPEALEQFLRLLPAELRASVRMAFTKLDRLTIEELEAHHNRAARSSPEITDPLRPKRRAFLPPQPDDFRFEGDSEISRLWQSIEPRSS